MKPYIKDNKKQLWYEDTDGNIKFRKENLNSLFKMDWLTFLLMLVIIILGLLYSQGVSECRQVMEAPCRYCANAIINWTPL